MLPIENSSVALVTQSASRLRPRSRSTGTVQTLLVGNPVFWVIGSPKLWGKSCAAAPHWRVPRRTRFEIWKQTQPRVTAEAILPKAGYSAPNWRELPVPIPTDSCTNRRSGFCVTAADAQVVDRVREEAERSKNVWSLERFSCRGAGRPTVRDTKALAPVRYERRVFRASLRRGDRVPADRLVAVRRPARCPVDTAICGACETACWRPRALPQARGRFHGVPEP